MEYMEELFSDRSVPRIHRIVLTGGPGGGKSHALPFVKDRLTSAGFTVFTVPEAATLLMKMTGVNLSDLAWSDRPRYFQAQREIIQIQRSLRLAADRLALSSPPARTVAIFDRGELDATAYLTPEGVNLLFHEEGMDRASYNALYTAIFHLVTAASGESKSYTKDTNLCRTEGPERARELDRLTQAAWTGHPNWHRIPASPNFQDKLESLVSQILDQLPALPQKPGVGDPQAPSESLW
jgi:predicted ATPase